jgi:hypothetical protein
VPCGPEGRDGLPKNEKARVYRVFFSGLEAGVKKIVLASRWPGECAACSILQAHQHRWCRGSPLGFRDARGINMNAGKSRHEEHA